MEINVRGNDPYYSQRNNKIRPLAACNVTSMIAALDYAGYKFPNDPNYDQPEDSLLNFILTSADIDAQYQKLFPDEYKKYISSGKDFKNSFPPNELHPLLSLGTNLWMKKSAGSITHFRWDLTLRDMVFEFLNGRPIVTSGVFNGLHHVICLTGIETIQEDIKSVTNAANIDLNKISTIITEDPYGDFHTKYTVQKGQDVRITIDEFNTFINVQGQPQKWGHVFVKA